MRPWKEPKMAKVGTAVLEIKAVVNEDALQQSCTRITSTVAAAVAAGLNPVCGDVYERDDLGVNVEWYDQTSSTEYAGLIEDKARSWIIYLDRYGVPSVFWPRRHASGAVIGNPIDLAVQHADFAADHSAGRFTHGDRCGACYMHWHGSE